MDATSCSAVVGLFRLQRMRHNTLSQTIRMKLSDCHEWKSRIAISLAWSPFQATDQKREKVAQKLDLDPQEDKVQN